MSDSGTARPSRPLLTVTIVVVIAFTVLRFVTAATLDLRTDEAYYWTWADQYVLSYLDQPPMVAWVERFGIAIFGNTPLGVRFGQLLILPLIELILADIARRRTGSWNAALLVVLAMECTLNYGFFSIVVEPNLPLLLFSSLAIWSLSRLDETDEPRWWLLAGAALGVALLSKFLVVLLAPALLVFLLFPGPRKTLATLWPYLAAALALAIFSPVLIWNAQHDWVAFGFQATRLRGGSDNTLLRYLTYEVLWIGPVLFVAVIAGTIAMLVRGLRTRDGFAVALATAVFVPLAYFAWRSLGVLINQSWSWFIWPFGILALSLALPWQKAPRWITALAVAIVAVGMPLPLAFFYHANFDRLVWFGDGDPFGQDAGFDDAGRKVLALAAANDVQWVATTEYRIYAALKWQIGRDIPVVMVTERSRFIGFAPEPAPSGRAIYIHSREVEPLLAGAALTPLEPIPVMWRETQMRTLGVDLLDDYTVDLSPLPGSPFYDTTL